MPAGGVPNDMCARIGRGWGASDVMEFRVVTKLAMNKMIKYYMPSLLTVARHGTMG